MISSSEVGADITASSAWNTLMAPVIWSLGVLSNKGDFWCFWMVFVWKLSKCMGWFSFLCTFEYFPACPTWTHFCINLFIVFWWYFCHTALSGRPEKAGANISRFIWHPSCFSYVKRNRGYFFYLLVIFKLSRSDINMSFTQCAWGCWKYRIY